MSVMEKERPKSISGNDKGVSEGSATSSPTNCKSTDSRDDKAETELQPQTEPEKESEPELEDTMANLTVCTPCRAIEHQKLKLIVRSQYWGRELKGRTCRNVYTNMNNRAPLVITTQAVLYNTDNTDGFWGCCPNHGKRVLELQEYHFSDASEDGHWDLYLNQTQVDVERNVRLNGWSYFGTCNKGKIRSGIDDLLRGLLLQNDAYGHRYHHVHIDIMMDKAFDRETPRSRKINNERARAERKKHADSPSQNYDRQESSVTTDATESTDQESQPPPPPAHPVDTSTKSFPTKVIGAAPSIPRYVTNDMSYVMPMTQSLPTPIVGYQDIRWTREPTHWSQDQFSVPARSTWLSVPLGQVASGGDHQGMQWYPAKAVPVPGGMHQQSSYWQQANSAQFATAPTQPYYHLPEVQVHQYPVGVQHTPLSTEMQHYSMPYPESTYYNGVTNTPESSFGGDPSMIFREVHEGRNMGSVQYPLPNVSTSDGSIPPHSSPELGSSSPPAMHSASPVPETLETIKVSPITATTDPTVVSSEHSPRGSPSNAAPTELGHIPTPSQLLIPGDEER